jgi:two-component system chemotaxis response regulator CheB
MIRVLVAEDSATARQFLIDVLSADADIEIAGTAENGIEAVEAARRLRPDVIAMDIKMPVMDGFEAAKRIMIEVPTPIVIMSATMDVRDVNVSMNALRVGALALLEKPPGPGAPRFEESLRHLVFTIKAMAGVKVVRHAREPLARPGALSTADLPAVGQVRVIAMAASTGGPAALGRILAGLPAQFAVPILVVQHMARGFIAGMASWLSATCALQVKVALDHDLLQPSTVYLAGEDCHLGVARGARIALDDSPPIGGFRPSATHLFDSVGKAFGTSAVAVMLTGMGQDGVEGLRTVRRGGGRILVQDEQSSVVFGMPGAAVAAKLADKILPLSSISEALIHLTGGQADPVFTKSDQSSVERGRGGA